MYSTRPFGLHAKLRTTDFFHSLTLGFIEAALDFRQRFTEKRHSLAFTRAIPVLFLLASS
jgi:hypothetical protein